MVGKAHRQKLREDARAILDACLMAVDPERVVKACVSVNRSTLRVGTELTFDLDRFDRVLVVGAGKASAPMAKALEEILGDRISGGLVCVKYDHGLPLERSEVVEAAHPVPDRSGEIAGRRIIQLLESAGERDLIISCVSGGGSALLPGLRAPITLEEKRRLIEALLRSGADIHEMNAVRKHLSTTKGGALMQAAYPATVVNLTLSDVVGDDLDTIASGPFTPDRSTFRDALSVLQKRDLIDRAPESIKQRLNEGVAGVLPETPKEGDPIFERAHNLIVGSNRIALEAGKRKSVELGYETLILSSSIEGETGEAARFHAAIAREIRLSGNPISPPACILSGGETTVQVTGSGQGGRNQQFALELVEQASAIPNTLFLSAGTDGTDGPTDAAGAIVDDETACRSLGLGLDVAEHLDRNDSYGFFEKLGDLIVTGPTRTNVMDAHIILVGYAPERVYRGGDGN